MSYSTGAMVTDMSSMYAPENRHPERFCSQMKHLDRDPKGGLLRVLQASACVIAPSTDIDLLFEVGNI
jgi:hypothetical protein